MCFSPTNLLLRYVKTPRITSITPTPNSKLLNISFGIFIENTKINKLTITSEEVCPAPHNAPRIELLIAPE